MVVFKKKNSIKYVNEFKNVHFFQKRSDPEVKSIGNKHFNAFPKAKYYFKML